MVRFCSFLAGVVVGLFAFLSPLSAQTPMLWQSLDLEYGVHRNDGAGPISVPLDSISLPGAASLQLRFDRLDLGHSADALIVRNPLDGQEMRLERGGLRDWQNHTAWFNGDTLELSLVLSPGSVASVALAGAQIFPLTAFGPLSQPDAICGGTDDRNPSNRAAVCRLVGNGVCTGFLVGGTGTVLSAGHCGVPAPGALVVAQFRVPASTAGGTLVHPLIGDQYPVDSTSTVVQSGGIGDDYSVFRLHPNAGGGSAVARQATSLPLATSLPTYIPILSEPTLRVTGYGVDSGSSNGTQQTATGPYRGHSGGIIEHRVDTEGGNSGSPILLESTNEVIGIHTNGGCDSGSNNSGTSILLPGLQSALLQVEGTDFLSLLNNILRTTTANRAIFSYATAASRWNAIVVTSGSDYDLRAENRPGSGMRAISAQVGTAAEILVANGRLDNRAPAVSGEINRRSGSLAAEVKAVVALPFTIGTSINQTFTATTIVRAFEFEVTTAGAYDVQIAGDPGHRWVLLEPGTTSDWQPFDQSTIAQGLVGSGASLGLNLDVGWHCIVVTRDGGRAATTPDPAQLSISVCPVGSGPILSQSPAAASNCGPFSISLDSEPWSVVALSAESSPWEMSLGTAYESVPAGETRFVAFDASAGTVSPRIGVTQRSSGSGNATLQWLPVQSITVDAANTATIPAGDLGRVFTFDTSTVSSGLGNYWISITSDDQDFDYALMGPGTATWRTRDSARTSENSRTGARATLVTNAGVWALVVTRRASDLALSTELRVRVCSPASLTTLGNSASGIGFTTECLPFSITPLPARWNAVAVLGQNTARYGLDLGGIGDVSDLNGAALLVASGRAGTIDAVRGLAMRDFGLGAPTARVAHGPISTLTLGATTTTSFGPADVVRLFEFQVLSTGFYDILVQPVGAIGSSQSWALYAPASSSAWQARASSLASGSASSVGGPTRLELEPGWHALVLTQGWTSLPSTVSLDVRVTQVPNPAPTLLSLDPDFLPQGASGRTIRVLGADFSRGSVVQIDFASVPTTYVSGTELTAEVPASATMALGTVPVQVVNPSPGGGISAILPLTIGNPAPILSSVAPDRIPAGQTSVLQLEGSFLPSAVARWNGNFVSTRFVSATRLEATISAAVTGAAGATGQIAVEHPTPGGGLSGALPVSIENSVPTALNLMPAAAIAGGPGFTLQVFGSDFATLATIEFEGTSLATTWISGSELRATVPASSISSPAIRNVRVRNPSPGGGLSNILTFAVNGPVITGFSPASVPIQSPGTTVLVRVQGMNFLATSSVVACADLVPTTYISATELEAELDADSLLVLQVHGALPITVVTGSFASSNTLPLVIGGGLNRGVMSRNPTLSTPSTGFTLNLEGGFAFAPLTLLVDFAPVTSTSLFPFIDATANYALNVRLIDPGDGSWLAIADGLGLYGVPASFAFFDAAGTFSLGGLATPPIPLGLNATLQALYPDPRAAVGYSISWPRAPERF